MNRYIPSIMFSLLALYAPLWAMHQENILQAENAMEEELSPSDAYPMITIDLQDEGRTESTALTGAIVKTGSFTRHIDANSYGMHINISAIKKVTFYYFPGLKNLSLYCNHYENLQHIEALNAAHLPNLQDINLMGNQMKTFSLGDKPFHYLSCINVSDNHIENIDFLQFAPNIENFSLHSNKLQSLNFGSSVEFLSLKNLDLGDNHIVSLEPLGWLSLPSLRRLKLNGNWLRSLKGIDKAEMQRLTILELWQMDIPDLSPITKGHFTLTHCGVETYTHLLCKLDPKSVPEIFMSNADELMREGNMTARSRDGMISFLREQASSTSKVFRYLRPR